VEGSLSLKLSSFFVVDARDFVGIRKQVFFMKDPRDAGDGTTGSGTEITYPKWLGR
jgi:hypothetical protein